MKKDIFSITGKVAFALLVFLTADACINPDRSDWGLNIMMCIGFCTVLAHNGLLYGLKRALEKGSLFSRLFLEGLYVALLIFIALAWIAWSAPDIDHGPNAATLFVLVNVTANCIFSAINFIVGWNLMMHSRNLSAFKH